MRCDNCLRDEEEVEVISSTCNECMEEYEKSLAEQAEQNRIDAERWRKWLAGAPKFECPCGRSREEIIAAVDALEEK